jgi:GntR family transcriptional regulator, vanillate catabolism transcriptional regulator
MWSMAPDGERGGASPNDVDGGDPAATSQTTRALLSLRELLLSGEFPSGTRMSELPLVERLGVSRTPLRLALATLEHEGLLEMLSGGGYAVREFTRDDVHDAIELRGVLEGTAARFAAERGATPEQLTEMKELSAQMEGTVHRDDEDSFWRYVELNARFHALLLEAAASPVLARELERIVSLPFASPSAFVRGQAELPESRAILVIAQDHHRALIEAIEGREAARAEALAREHARVAQRNLEIVLANRDVLERIPGGSLIRLVEHTDDAAPDSIDVATTKGSSRKSQTPKS